MGVICISEVTGKEYEILSKSLGGLACKGLV